MPLSKFPQLASIIEAIKSRFRYILLDAPPILPLADINALTGLAEILLFVVRSGRTPKDVVLKATDMLKTSAQSRLILTDAWSQGMPYYVRQGYEVPYAIGEKRGMIQSQLDDLPQVMPEHIGFFDRLLETFGLKRRVLILGDGGLANNLARVLVANGRNRFEVVGFLSKDVGLVGPPVSTPSVIGTIDQLFELTENYRVQTVAVCFEDRRGTMPLDALLDIKSLGVEVVDGHRMYEAECGRLSIDELKPSFLIFSQGFRRKPVVMVLKRIVDLIGAFLGLLLLAPLLLIIAMVIKLDSPGPVFYRQTRIGLHGYPYVLRKFRSMRQNAEEQGAKWASVSDDRVTRVGYWLRRLRLDELPQFLNVLKGEMSLVGPRPERPHFVQELRTFIPFYDLRHTVRPGITGWAQTCFQYAASLEDSHMKLQYDLYYVKNLSLVLDFRILLRTFHVVLLGTGAR